MPRFPTPQVQCKHPAPPASSTPQTIPLQCLRTQQGVCLFICLPPFLWTGMCCYPHQLTHSRSSTNTLKRMTELVFSDYFLNFSINSCYLIILPANRLPPPACKGNLCLHLAWLTLSPELAKPEQALVSGLIAAATLTLLSPSPSTDTCTALKSWVGQGRGPAQGQESGIFPSLGLGHLGPTGCPDWPPWLARVALKLKAEPAFLAPLPPALPHCIWFCRLHHSHLQPPAPNAD